MTKSRQRQSPARPKNPPRLGSGIVADAFESGSGGRVTLSGIITVFYAWAFPSTRRCHVALTILHLPRGKTSLIASLNGPRPTSKAPLQIVNIEVQESDATATVPIPVVHTFEVPGEYRILVTFRDHPGRLIIPFEVRLKDWPTFTRSEIAYARAHTDFPRALRANVQCERCSSPYIFEESVDEGAPIPAGVRRFPQGGSFKCAECGHSLHLKDLQGQLRAALKDIIKKESGGK